MGLVISAVNGWAPGMYCEYIDHENIPVRILMFGEEDGVELGLGIYSKYVDRKLPSAIRLDTYRALPTAEQQAEGGAGSGWQTKNLKKIIAIMNEHFPDEEWTMWIDPIDLFLRFGCENASTAVRIKLEL